MRFLILAIVAVLFATSGVNAACGSANGRSGLLAKFRANREARQSQNAVRTISACSPR